jgi:thiosulfate reductase cytochrome b subunit
MTNEAVDVDAITMKVISDAKGQDWYAEGVAQATAAELSLLTEMGGRGYTGAHLKTVMFMVGFIEGFNGAAFMSRHPAIMLSVAMGMNYLTIGEAYANDHLRLTRAPWLLGFREATRVLRAA